MIAFFDTENGKMLFKGNIVSYEFQGPMEPPAVIPIFSLSEIDAVLDYLSGQFPRGYVIENGKLKPFERPKEAYAVGFENPEDGFIRGPFENLKDALEIYGTVGEDGEGCYVYHVTGTSSRRIRKWDPVSSKWKFFIS